MFEKAAEEYAEGTKTEKELKVLETVHYWGQESLTPDERRLFEGIQDRKRARKQGFKDGAEFGYNKANEWHCNGIPHDNKPYLCKVEQPTKYTSEEIKNRLSNIGETIGTIALEYIIQLEKENEQIINKMKNCSNCKYYQFQNDAEYYTCIKNGKHYGKNYRSCDFNLENWELKE